MSVRLRDEGFHKKGRRFEKGNNTPLKLFISNQLSDEKNIQRPWIYLSLSLKVSKYLSGYNMIHKCSRLQLPIRNKIQLGELLKNSKTVCYTGFLTLAVSPNHKKGRASKAFLGLLYQIFHFNICIALDWMLSGVRNYMKLHL